MLIERQNVDERAVALEQELGDFSYIVSHDLMATFRHVKGFLGLLARDLDPTLTDRQRDFVARIDGAADACQTMLDELRVYSRVQQQPLALADCDGARLFEAARLQLAQAQDADVEIRVGALGAVRADHRLLVDALRRVLDNAVKFRRPDAPVRVEVERAADETDWVVRVTDNGIGVDPGLREKVFQMFYRARRDTPGQGAGLTICRRIFRRHGGDVRLVDCDQGACVELRLPLTGGGGAGAA
ncbi:ATP-binding protein [Phenylobacterium sp.]|uniref:sensor histidine kinase n=1 Tax=Phenylobacterium sp. TaxID=1871053 RepID=UPI0035B101E4